MSSLASLGPGAVQESQLLQVGIFRTPAVSDSDQRSATLSSTMATTTSGGIHPRLIAALSPPSHFYFTLWPLIIAKSSFLFRQRTLRKVNHEFRKYVDSVEDPLSVRAKRRYMYQRSMWNSAISVFALELPLDSVVEWREWGAHKAGFENVEDFREFCALGDIDPDAVVKYELRRTELTRLLMFLCEPDSDGYFHYCWSSRGKDILVFSLLNPLEPENHEPDAVCCHDFGIVVWLAFFSLPLC
ncbi:hypothetical protein BS47DRAFT_1349968 [Hydnum rufescens UP504]|uniref:Uncharacterized protein n=1 Tax=Hydnum rufescens UP504 TaxID=1448309 RepID=A0A9P6AN62_9AGAM|nr:hypothetical protein BS47DRAFT_1349968 [Hydnum rufescens UP504]